MVSNFPFPTFVGMLALSACFIYYVNMETAFRETNKVRSLQVEEEHSEQRHADEEFVRPDYTPPTNSLDALEAETEAKNKASNADAKKAFADLKGDEEK